MTEIAGGEQFARGLRAEGIEFLFELPSPEVDPLLAELESHGIRQVLVRHEAAGVHMAAGSTRRLGRSPRCSASQPPGSANLSSGMVTALHEDVPVLVITSQHRLGGVYPSPPSRFLGQDQLDLLRPAVKWGGPAFGWRRIPVVLRLACEMWNGRPGPVHVELPALVLYPTEDDETAPVTPPAAYGGTTRQASDAGSELPVVVLRLRGRTTLGATAFIVLANYAQRIRAAGGHLFLSGLGPDLLEQLHHAHRVDLQDAEEWLAVHACYS